MTREFKAVVSCYCRVLLKTSTCRGVFYTIVLVLLCNKGFSQLCSGAPLPILLATPPLSSVYKAGLSWSLQGPRAAEREGGKSTGRKRRRSTSSRFYLQKVKMNVCALALGLALVLTACVARSPFQAVLQHSRIRGRTHG